MIEVRKLLLCALALGTLLASVGSAQSLEKTIMLPDTLECPGSPYSLVRNPSNGKVYVGCESGVLVIDGTTNRRLACLKTGGWVMAMSYNPQNNKVYCAEADLNKVVVIGGATDSVIATIGVGFEPRALCYNSKNNRIYCANHQDSDVTVIDGATNSVVATVRVGDGPYGLCYNPQNNKVYCADQWSGGDVAVMDGAKDSVIATVWGAPGWMDTQKHGCSMEGMRDTSRIS